MPYGIQVPKLHIKNDISQHMVKVFIYINAVICLGFERPVSHLPKEVPPDLY